MLTKGIDEIQAAFKLTRTDWQLLNTINESGLLNKGDLIKIMEPFADAEKVALVLTRLQSENIAAVTAADCIALTEKGQQLHHACLQKQQAFRQKAMTGIEKEAYRTTVQTLQKITGNISNTNM